MSARDEDAEAKTRAAALMAVDPRAGQRKHRARLELYGDDERTGAELGAELLDEFIDPDRLPARRIGKPLRRKQYK